MGKIIIREYDSRYRSSCLQLLKRTYPATSDDSTFQWRFETDRSNRPVLVCAMDNDSVVSFCSWLPWEFLYEKTHYLGYQAGEAATAIPYRRKGLWSSVLQYGEKLVRQRGGDFMFGFPSEMSYGPLSKAGYHFVGINYFRVRFFNPVLNRMNNCSPFHTDYPFSAMILQHGKISPIFDSDYCTWRYGKNTKSFDQIVYTENNASAIFFVRKQQWRGLPEVLLLDSQFGSYNQVFVDNSFRFLDSTFSRKALYMRTFFGEHTHRGRALRKHFSMRIKSKYHILIVKPLSNNLDNSVFLNFNCWDVMPHCIDEL